MSASALAIDGLVILVYFVVIVSVGLYKGRGESSMSDFAVGGRGIPWWAVLASILAAEISAATFLGTPGEGYAKRNFTYAQLAIGTILARLIIAWVFIKPYYDYKVVSIYEYLLVRFGTLTKNAASIVFLITRALASGTRLYVAAIVFVMGYEMLTSTHLSNSQQLWIYIGALTFVTTVTAIYTALGGIKAVVWTDVIQASIMFGSLGIAIWFLLRSIPGGWHGVTGALTAPSDFAFFDSGIKHGVGVWGNVRNIFESEYTIWAALIGSTFTTMATHGTDQDMVQRMLTAKDHRKSQLSLVLSGVADLPLNLCFLFVGILLWVHFRQPGKDAPFAFYIVHEMPAGVRGLLVAGLFSTAMGSLSTALNALATSFTQDWYIPYIRPTATDRQIVRAARLSTIFFSALLILIGSLTAYAKIVMRDVRIIPIVLGIFGYTYGSLLGIFLVGLLTRRRGSEIGNVVAMICGFCVVAIFSGLHNALWSFLRGEQSVLWKPAWLPEIEFPWRIAFGATTTFFVALCFPTPPAKIAMMQARLRECELPASS